MSCALSIVVPTYNEAKRIGPTLDDIAAYCAARSLSAEIIVVDDGSTDATDAIVERLCERIPILRLLRSSTNTGKGSAVKRGIEASVGDDVLFVDADNATPISELERLATARHKTNADIAIGSRHMPGSRIRRQQPFHRVLLSRLGNAMIRTVLLPELRDTQCGFKLFRGDVARRLVERQTIMRFGFDMELLVIAQHLGYRIVEVPVEWRDAPGSRFRPIKDGFRTLRDLVRIKRNITREAYK